VNRIRKVLDERNPDVVWFSNSIASLLRWAKGNLRETQQTDWYRLRKQLEPFREAIIQKTVDCFKNASNDLNAYTLLLLSPKEQRILFCPVPGRNPCPTKHFRDELWAGVIPVVMDGDEIDLACFELLLEWLSEYCGFTAHCGTKNCNCVFFMTALFLCLFQVFNDNPHAGSAGKNLAPEKALALRIVKAVTEAESGYDFQATQCFVFHYIVREIVNREIFGNIDEAIDAQVNSQMTQMLCRYSIEGPEFKKNFPDMLEAILDSLYEGSNPRMAEAIDVYSTEYILNYDETPEAKREANYEEIKGKVFCLP